MARYFVLTITGKRRVCNYAKLQCNLSTLMIDDGELKVYGRIKKIPSLSSSRYLTMNCRQSRMSFETGIPLRSLRRRIWSSIFTAVALNKRFDSSLTDFCPAYSVSVMVMRNWEFQLWSFTFYFTRSAGRGISSVSSTERCGDCYRDLCAKKPIEYREGTLSGQRDFLRKLAEGSMVSFDYIPARKQKMPLTDFQYLKSRYTLFRINVVSLSDLECSQLQIWGQLYESERRVGVCISPSDSGSWWGAL